jgi:hypothetical protein
MILTAKSPLPYRAIETRTDNPWFDARPAVCPNKTAHPHLKAGHVVPMAVDLTNQFWLI